MPEEKSLSPLANVGTNLPVAFESERHLADIMSRLTKVNDIALRHTLHLSGGHSGSIIAILPVPGQPWFLTGSDDATIRLWDEPSRTALQVYQGHTQNVRGLAMRPRHDDQFVSVSWDQTAILWGLHDARVLRKFSGHTGRIRKVAFFPDGERFVTVAADKTVRLWSVEQGSCLATRPDHQAEVRNARVSCDGQRVYTCDENGGVICWNRDLTAIVWRFQDPGNEICDLLLDRDEHQLALAAKNREVLAVSAETGALAHRWKVAHDAMITLCAGPDADSFYAGTDDGFVLRMSWKTGQVLFTYAGPTYGTASVAWLNEDELLYVANNTAVVYSLERGEGRRIFCHKQDAHPNVRLESMALSPNRETLALASRDSTITLWNYQTGELAAWLRVDEKDRLGFVSVGYSHDGQYLIACMNRCWVYVWDARTKKQILKLKASEQELRGAVIVPGHQHIVTIGRGVSDNLKVWSLKGRLLQDLPGHTDTVFGIALSPDGKTFATAGGDGTARVWSAETYECLHVLEGFGGWLMSVGYSGDSRRLVAAGEVNQAMVWDVASGGAIACVKLDSGLIDSAGLNQDGSRLAIGTKQDGIRILTLPGQQVTHRIRGNWHRYYDAVLNHDQTRLLTTAYTQVLSWAQDSGLDCRIYGATQRPVTSLCVDDYKNMVYIAAEYAGAKGLDMGRGECKFFMSKGLNSIVAMLTRLAGSQLITADHTNMVCGVAVADGKRNLFISNSHPLSKLTYARANLRLYYGDEGGNVTCYDIDRHEVRDCYCRDQGKIVGLGLNFEEDVLSAVNDKGQVYLIDVEKDRLEHYFLTPTRKASALAVKTDWQAMLIGDPDSNLFFYRQGTPALLWQRTLEAGISELLAIPDMPYACVGLNSGDILMIDEQGETIRRFQGHQAGQKITALDYSMKRSMIVSGSQDGTVKFWNLEDGALLGSYYCLEKGFLWTTPGDELAPQGWFYTDQPELINLIECDQDGQHPRPSTHEAENRVYFTMYHRQDQVMKRIFNYAAYQQEQAAAKAARLPGAVLPKLLK